MTKTKKIILDSSVFVAYLNENDNQHKKALEIFKNLDINKMFISEYVLLEVLTVIQNKVSKSHALKFKNFILDNFSDSILRSSDFFDDTLDLFGANSGNLSFVDVSLLVLSKKYEVITFDKSLKRAIGSYGKKRSK